MFITWMEKIETAVEKYWKDHSRQDLEKVLREWGMVILSKRGYGENKTDYLLKDKISASYGSTIEEMLGEIIEAQFDFLDTPEAKDSPDIYTDLLHFIIVTDDTKNDIPHMTATLVDKNENEAKWEEEWKENVESGPDTNRDEILARIKKAGVKKMADKCSAVKKDRTPCLNPKVKGFEFCFCHLPPEVRKIFRAKPLRKEELAIILSKEIRLARRIKGPAERTKRIQDLVTLLLQLDGEKKITSDDPVDSVDKAIKEWKKNKAQI